MIDEDRTMQLFGYCSTELKPRSNKPIVRVCEECGGYKIVPKDGYRPICHRCKMGSNEVRIKLSESHTGAGIKHHKFDDLPIDEICKQYLSGVSRDELGQIYGCCNETIKNRLVENGITLRISNNGRVCSNEVRDKIRNGVLQFNENHPEAGEMHSAWWQDQDYDAGEWTGYTDKHRPHLIPAAQCIHLNNVFDWCNQHHIMTGVVINIPVDMHKGTWHIMADAKRESVNMKKINELALKYLIEGI